jgi:hypothetical protein
MTSMILEWNNRRGYPGWTLVVNHLADQTGSVGGPMSLKSLLKAIAKDDGIDWSDAGSVQLSTKKWC